MVVGGVVGCGGGCGGGGVWGVVVVGGVVGCGGGCGGGVCVGGGGGWGLAVCAVAGGFWEGLEPICVLNLRPQTSGMGPSFRIYDYQIRTAQVFPLVDALLLFVCICLCVLLTAEASGTELFYEVGVVSESEFLRLVGVPPADLKKKATLLKSTEEGGTLKVWFVSLRGLDVGELHAIRKMRVYHKVEVVQDQVLLDHAEQLCEHQAKSWFDFAQSKQMDKRPHGCKISQRGLLPTIASLQEDAEKVLATRRQQLKDSIHAKRKKPAGSESDEDEEGEDDNQAGKEQGNVSGDEEDELAKLLEEGQAGAGVPARPKAKAVASACLRLGQEEEEPKRPVKRRKAKDADADGEPEADAEDADNQPKSELQQLEADDPDMHEVAMKHQELTKTGTKASLWKQLQVAHALADDWDGRTLTAVGGAQLG